MKLFLIVVLYFFAMTSAKNYYAFNAKVKFWEAFQACQTLGLQLATINSEEEQTQLNSVVTAANITGWYWTGGTDWAKYKTFSWLPTGKPLTYKNWNQGKPNFTGGYKRCLCVSAANNKWYDSSCFARKISYVCENRDACPEIQSV